MARIISGECIPERARPAPDGELFPLIEREREIAEKGKNSRDEAEGERAQRNAHRRAAITVMDKRRGQPHRLDQQSPALEYLMPLFEYECRGCGHHFEHLTRGDQARAR